MLAVPFLKALLGLLAELRDELREGWVALHGEELPGTLELLVVRVAELHGFLDLGEDLPALLLACRLVGRRIEEEGSAHEPRLVEVRVRVHRAQVRDQGWLLLPWRPGVVHVLEDVRHEVLDVAPGAVVPDLVALKATESFLDDRPL